MFKICIATYNVDNTESTSWHKTNNEPYQESTRSSSKDHYSSHFPTNEPPKILNTMPHLIIAVWSDHLNQCINYLIMNLQIHNIEPLNPNQTFDQRYIISWRYHTPSSLWPFICKIMMEYNRNNGSNHRITHRGENHSAFPTNHS